MSLRKQPIHRCTVAKADLATGCTDEDWIEAGSPAVSLPQTVTTPVAAKIVGRSADTLKR